MSSQDMSRDYIANQPHDGAQALIMYDPHSQAHVTPDPLADVVLATQHIRDNTYGLLDLLEDYLHHGVLDTNDDTKEILSLIRDQLNEIYMMAMGIKDHTGVAIRKNQVSYSKEMQGMISYYLGREQGLRNTIAIQQSTVLTLQQNLSNLTLKTGLLRGEAMAMNNENYVLRQKKEDAESGSNVLQTMAKEYSQQLEQTLERTVKKEASFDKLMEDVTKERRGLEQQKRVVEQQKRTLEQQKRDLEHEKEAYTERLAASSKPTDGEEEKVDMKKKLDENIKALDHVMLENQELKIKLERAVEDVVDAIEKRCSATEQLRNLHNEYQALKEEASLAKSKEAKGKEENAAEEQEMFPGKLEKLQLELEGERKINEKLLRDLNEAKEDSEFFARQAKVSGERELRALAEMESMKAEAKGK